MEVLLPVHSLTSLLLTSGGMRWYAVDVKNEQFGS